MNPILLIFTQIAVTGCGFLVYFLYALRRESLAKRKPRVEIRPASSQITKGDVVQLGSTGKVQIRGLRRSSGR